MTETSPNLDGPIISAHRATLHKVCLTDPEVYQIIRAAAGAPDGATITHEADCPASGLTDGVVIVSWVTDVTDIAQELTDARAQPTTEPEFDAELHDWTVTYEYGPPRIRGTLMFYGSNALSTHEKILTSWIVSDNDRVAGAIVTTKSGLRYKLVGPEFDPCR